jgi:hypothetical protein
LLREGGTGLPDADSVLPFLGLYTLIILKDQTTVPTHDQTLSINTSHMPELSVLQGHEFVSAPPGTQASSTVWIFSVMNLPEEPPWIPGQIPLHPSHPEFNHQCLWRLPTEPEVILSRQMELLGSASHNSAEMTLAMYLNGRLNIITARSSVLATRTMTAGGQYGSGFGAGGSTGESNTEESDQNDAGEDDIGDGAGSNTAETGGNNGAMISLYLG